MRSSYLAALLLVACWVVPSAAQDKPTPPPASSPGSGAPMQAKVTIVISRQLGEKKLSSLPYVFGVLAGERTNLRMGSDVPIATKGQPGGPITPNVSYRTVGTNIDCALNVAGGGLYRLLMIVEDSSVHLGRDQKPDNPAFTSDFPSFRTFKATFFALLRDGQTMQHTSATDPASGEVMKVDVTLNVLK